MTHLLTKINKNIVLLMALFMVAALITSCGEDPIDPDPSTVVANFSSQVDADNSLTYDFTNNSVVNGIDDKTFTSAWDFGGDGNSSEESPSHTFSAEGTYEVKLTVTASDGVVATATETIEVTAPKNRYAVITDTRDDDTGELRLGLDSIQTGRVTFMYSVAAGPVDMDIKDAFINVTGTSTSGKNSIVEVRLKDNANHEFREGASDATIAAANFPEGKPDVWVAVEISWASDGTNAPIYTVVIDGQTVITDAPSTTRDPNDADMVAEHLATTIDGAHNFQWKYNSTSSTNDGFYFVDDIVIYSSDSGTETVVFEDDFQGRVKGEDLDPDTNSESPYHVNTSEATVGEDE
ncbi:MAG: PKD domain-containing protein [Bacteroidia bacterium]|nr:PKD domain-containing protein [Bacteroidia bacterium]